ncbi:MAG: hypothetical protein IPO30_20080 [Hyphomonadaceae bacterium]|nr:hypothetical protein [Hyphomonadaceae bacterium]
MQPILAPHLRCTFYIYAASLLLSATSVRLQLILQPSAHTANVIDSGASELCHFLSPVVRRDRGFGAFPHRWKPCQAVSGWLTAIANAKALEGLLDETAQLQFGETLSDIGLASAMRFELPVGRSEIAVLCARMTQILDQQQIKDPSRGYGERGKGWTTEHVDGDPEPRDVFRWAAVEPSTPAFPASHLCGPPVDRRQLASVAGIRCVGLYRDPLDP